MEQSLSNLEKQPTFVFPNIESERGEIVRTAEAFNKPDGFVEQFIETAKNITLSELTNEIWKELENSDSFDIENWEDVENHTNHYNQESGYNRDWRDLKEKIEQRQEVDAPIILKTENKYHLVSGNTRLMVARAANIKPQVLIVEME